MRRIASKMASEWLEREVPYSILLPAGYESSDLKYPILYLLHGLFGSHENWLDLTNIEELSKTLGLIIVMPDGSDGWYCDSEVVSSNRYETFFVDEFIPSIERGLRAIPAREARAIAGLSMGGYGAFKFSLRRPDLFTFAASFSGAFDAPERSDDAPGFDWNTLKPSILQAFGDSESETRARNDLFLLIESIRTDEVRSLPYFYFNCGLNDGFIEANIRLHQAFNVAGVDHQFDQIEGGHDWDYWGSQLPRLLKMTSELLVRPE